MKKYIVSMIMMMAGLAAFASTNEGKKESKSNHVSVTPIAEVSPVIAIKQLQLENIQLKQQVIKLQNEKEEMQSMIAFEGLMHNMFSTFGNKKHQDQVEDLNAMLSYNKLMASMFHQIQPKH